MDKEKSVTASPYLYNRAFAKLPFPLILVDGELNIVDINDNASHLTGLTNLCIGKSLNDIFQVNNISNVVEFAAELDKPQPVEVILRSQVSCSSEIHPSPYILSQMAQLESGYLIRIEKKLIVGNSLPEHIEISDTKIISAIQAISNTATHAFSIVDLDEMKYIIRNLAHFELEKRVIPNKEYLNMPLLVDSSVPLNVYRETMEQATVPFIEKHEYLGVDGQKLYYEVYGYPIFTNDKRHLIILHYRDITKERMAENSLIELNKYMEDILTNLPGMIFRCLNEPNFTMEYLSGGCRALTGYLPEELINNARLKFGDIIFPEDKEMVRSQIQQAVSKQKYYNIKYRIIHKKKHIIWVAERGRGSYDEEGNVIAIEGFISDISEGKIAEINLKKELMISEAIAHISMELLKDEVTPIKISRLVQEYMKEITGSKLSLIYSPEENGSGFSLFNHSDNEELISVKTADFTLNQLEFLTLLAESGTPKIYNEPTSVFLPGFSSEAINISSYLSVPAFINNKLSGLLILGETLSGYDEESIAVAQRFINMFALGLYRLKAEESLQDAKVKAEESDRLKSLFLSNMSHEIRTPMNAIVGFAEMLQDTDLEVEQKNKFLEVIIKSGDNLLRLINDIIDISRIEAGQLKLDYSDCLVNEMINDLEIYFKQELVRQKKTNIRLFTRLGHPESDFTLSTDCVRLKQVLNNLISNAIKFTDEGFIEFGYRIITGQIEFFVRDSGIGIPADMKKIIFERFGQVREAISRNQTGTGLGLTISKNLVEMLGGSIWVESFLGEGSTFYFNLPLRLGFHVADQVKKDTDSDGQQVFTLQGKTILIVEDVDTNFFYLNSLLSRYNGKIIRATNGRKAVELVQTDPTIDLILMDIELPILDGYKATIEIRQIRPELPVIAQTAFAMMGERERSKEAGCNDYIAKPIRKEELISILKKYI